MGKTLRANPKESHRLQPYAELACHEAVIGYLDRAQHQAANAGITAWRLQSAAANCRQRNNVHRLWHTPAR